jgi:GntR family transcriptional regulator, transcriptional repressor for pyruvate dehydrogenase complex
MLALSAGDIGSIIETRMSQELGFVTLAAERIKDEELIRLKQTIDGMEAGNGEYDELDKEFHRIIASSASNTITAGIIDPLMNMFYKTYHVISKDKRNIAITIEQHIAIYEALKNRDPIEAHKNMYLHLDHVRKRVLDERKKT